LEDEVHWVSNRGAVRWMVRFTAMLWLLVLAISLVVFLVLPLGINWINVSAIVFVIALVSAIALPASQPLRVGFSREEMILFWAHRTERIRWDAIDRLTISQSANELEKPQDDRLCTGAVRLVGGRQRPLGNLIGSIAYPMIYFVAPEKSELWVVYRGGRVMKYALGREEANAAPDPGKAPKPE